MINEDLVRIRIDVISDQIKDLESKKHALVKKLRLKDSADFISENNITIDLIHDLN